MYIPTAILTGLIGAICFAPSLAAPVDDSALSKKPKIAVKPILQGPPVIIGAGTYPRATKLSDGTLLGTYTAFEGGNNIIRIILSTDNGQTWNQQGEVTRAPSNANDVDNPFVLQLPSGRILCAFRNHSKDPATGQYQYFRITICFSDDNGKNWQFLSEPTADPGPVTGNWEPFLRNARDGSLQIYYSRENSAQDQDTIERFSTDGGATWSAPQTISGVGITSRDGMTGVATITGDTLMAVFETETTGAFSVGAITSTDDGKTWGGRKIIYTPKRPNTSAGATQIINVGGTLVVSFMTNEEEKLKAPAPNYVSDTAVKLITSGDGGNTWGHKTLIGEVQSVWPGMVTLDDRNFLVLYDHGGVKAQKVMLK